MLAFALLVVEMAQEYLLAQLKRRTGGDELAGDNGILAMRPRAREVRAEHLDNRFIERVYN